SNVTSVAHADSARRESDQDALRAGGRQRAHAGGSRAVIRGDTRTHPPDRSQGAAQAAASLEVAETAGVYGWSARLESGCRLQATASGSHKARFRAVPFRLMMRAGRI